MKKVLTGLIIFLIYGWNTLAEASSKGPNIQEVTCDINCQVIIKLKQESERKTKILQYIAPIDPNKLKSLAQGTRYESIINEEADELTTEQLVELLEGSMKWSIDDFYRNLPNSAK